MIKQRQSGLGHACVYGLGWGDEGKGKIVDLLSPLSDYVVRFNGGANAGHTIWISGEKFALHLLPTGVLHESVTSIIGPGVVVDPIDLVAEIHALNSRGFDLSARLKISERAHLVLAYHKIEDQLSERAASESTRLGTTSRGIGPCYADKMRRGSAVRLVDLQDLERLNARLRPLASARKSMLNAQYGTDGGLDVEAMITELSQAAEILRPFICDTTACLHDALDEGRSILFEGANGVLLDIDHGTFPFVTSSSTGPHGIGAGAGVPPSLVTRLIGVSKAYATRVGAGPFVTELNDETGERIRMQGHEYGTTTGRPRRCGWFDAVTCRYSAQLTGTTDMALLHLDTLRGLDRIGLCTSYRCRQQTITTLPADSMLLDEARPVVEYLPGWSDSLGEIRTFEDLPAAARNYVERVEMLVGVPISLIGVGADRSQTIVRGALKGVLQVPDSSIVS